MFDALTAAIVFLFGLAIGSFLNVCIRRLPAAVSDDETSALQSMRKQFAAITFTPSACPACKTPIKPYDNIPVLSYAILRGRCRACRAPISLLYPTVELLTGLLFVACFASFGATPFAGKWAVFCAMMVILVFTDLRERLLPDLVTLGGTLLGLAISLFLPVGDGSALLLARRAFDFPPPEPALSLCDALLGAALGSGALWIIAELYFRLRRREGMGLGDVKMMALAGVFLGPKLTFLTLFMGSLAGSLAGVLFILSYRKERSYELPFGVFLAAGALFSVFFGWPVLHWYAGLFA